MCDVFGAHAVHMTTGGTLTNNFNAVFEQAAFVFADEVIQKGDKEAESTLKCMVTERSLRVERKGVDAKFVRNRLKIAMATNEHFAAPAGIDERRFAIFDVRPGPATQEERDAERIRYFTPLARCSTVVAVRPSCTTPFSWT